MGGDERRRRKLQRDILRTGGNGLDLCSVVQRSVSWSRLSGSWRYLCCFFGQCTLLVANPIVDGREEPNVHKEHEMDREQDEFR